MSVGVAPSSGSAGSRNVPGDVVPGLWDVHGLSDGGVSTAYVEQAVLQSVLTEEHSEEHPHLIVPETQQGPAGSEVRSFDPGVA